MTTYTKLTGGLRDRSDMEVFAAELAGNEDRMTDPEIHALYALTEALSPLDDATRARVLRWAYSRYVDDIDRRVAELAEARAS